MFRVIRPRGQCRLRSLRHQRVARGSLAGLGSHERACRRSPDSKPERIRGGLRRDPRGPRGLRRQRSSLRG